MALKKPQLILLAILLDNYENLVKNNEINAIAYWNWDKILIKETTIKNVFYLQNKKKKEEDFTIEEMRELIAKEEKEVISQITTTVGISTILALLGIPNI